MYMYTCREWSMRAHICRSQKLTLGAFPNCSPPPFFFLRQGRSLKLKPSSHLDWLATKP